jgi:hypothetical protein
VKSGVSDSPFRFPQIARGGNRSDDLVDSGGAAGRKVLHQLRYLVSFPLTYAHAKDEALPQLSPFAPMFGVSQPGADLLTQTPDTRRRIETLHDFSRHVGRQEIAR